MLFEHDVFISYPHLSNRTDSSGQNGWVARFHTDLKVRLENFLGRDARIWRDNRMTVGTVFGEAIRKKLQKSRVFLCILSPAYLESDWCPRELEAFRELAQQNGGLVLGDQSRIIPIIKTPIEDNQLDLDQSLFRKFYNEPEDRGGAPMPFAQIPNGYKYDDYDRTLNELAWVIKGIVKQLGEDQIGEIDSTIYLAETSSDQIDSRTKIEVELRARKFIVLPRNPHPTRTAKEYVDSVNNDLERSFMSIHLLGGLADSPGKSAVLHQNELAAERSASDPSFKRVIWITKNLSSTDEQAEFLEAFRANEDALRGAEVVERPLEDLKTRLLQILGKEPTKRENGLYNIYLMYDKQDDDLVEPVSRFLIEKGYDVILPPEEQRGLKYHKESLLRCDAALTIYGKAKFEWVQERYYHVVSKAKGWGREKDFSCAAILPTDPETKNKKMLFIFQRARILTPCYNGITEDALQISLNEFIDALETGVNVRSRGWRL